VYGKQFAIPVKRPCTGQKAACKRRLAIGVQAVAYRALVLLARLISKPVAARWGKTWQSIQPYRALHAHRAGINNLLNCVGIACMAA